MEQVFLSFPIILSDVSLSLIRPFFPAIEKIIKNGPFNPKELAHLRSTSCTWPQHRFSLVQLRHPILPRVLRSQPHCISKASSSMHLSLLSDLSEHVPATPSLHLHFIWYSFLAKSVCSNHYNTTIETLTYPIVMAKYFLLLASLLACMTAQ